MICSQSQLPGIVEKNPNLTHANVSNSIVVMEMKLKKELAQQSTN